MLQTLSTTSARHVTFRNRIAVREGDVKLNQDLLRALLLHIEEHATRPISDLQEIEIEGWNEADIAYHVLLAKEAGLIKARIDDVPDADDPGISHIAYSVERLTMEGHGFLGAVRDPKRLRAIKKLAAAAGAETVKTIAVVAEAYVLAKVKELTGIGED